jgi:thiamine biosynthesis lipoprotein
LFPAVACGRWREVELDGTKLRLPAGVHLDLGGIAKGWTADRVAMTGLSRGLGWVVVNAGGDLRVAGDAPPIDVRIEDPQDPTQDLAHVEITEGAVATSSVTKRTWAPDAHHVIDPRLGMPAQNGLLQATVWAPTAAGAEVRATHALLGGVSMAAEVPAVLVTRSGDVIVSFPQEVPA